MNASALVLLAIREGRAQQGAVSVTVDDDGITVQRTGVRVAIGLTAPQAVRLIALFEASTEATDVLVSQWLAAESAHHPQPEVSP